MSRVKWRSGSGGGGVGGGEQCGRGMERRRGKVGILEDEMKGGRAEREEEAETKVENRTE